MPFTSWDFLLYFLPLTVVVFHLIPPNPVVWRKLLLVFSSVVFYAWFSFSCAALLAASIAVNYLIGDWLGKRAGKTRHWPIAVTGICVNLLLLFHFKYSNMFKESIGSLLGVSVELPPLVLPLAISFYTFTQIGYLVDVAKNPHLRCGFVDYCLFVLFFPHLIAGPVVRHSEIVPQFSKRELRAGVDDLAAGTALFLMGLYKKTLLADPASVHADWIFDQAAAGESLSMFSTWMGAFAYGLQIYFDFSGYSDMAIGLACIFALRFPINFDSPFKARSISDFWRRWHISLTRFFRDYLYIPLGGNRKGLCVQIRNILITFLISGLWHGAGWTFVVWGALHGIFLAIHLSWRRVLDGLGIQIDGTIWNFFASVMTLLAVTFAWVFFRAEDLDSALRMTRVMIGFEGISLPDRWVARLDSLPVISELAKGVAIPSPSIGWFWTCAHLAALGAIAMFVPNTRQLLGYYRFGDLQHAEDASEKLKLRPVHGWILGLLLMGFVYTRFGSVPSPFIYFNF